MFSAQAHSQCQPRGDNRGFVLALVLLCSGSVVAENTGRQGQSKHKAGPRERQPSRQQQSKQFSLSTMCVAARALSLTTAAFVVVVWLQPKASTVLVPDCSIDMHWVIEAISPFAYHRIVSFSVVSVCVSLCFSTTSTVALCQTGKW